MKVGFIIGALIGLEIIILIIYFYNYNAQSKVEKSVSDPAEELLIERWYTPVYPMQVAQVDVLASIASTSEARIKGLSGTPSLPVGVVKLFVFDKSDIWSFWMKDMKYPIDIIWLDEKTTVIHIEKVITPATYPASYSSISPARYVIETKAGFVELNQIEIGDEVILPAILNN